MVSGFNLKTEKGTLAQLPWRSQTTAPTPYGIDQCAGLILRDQYPQLLPAPVPHNYVDQFCQPLFYYYYLINVKEVLRIIIFESNCYVE